MSQKLPVNNFEWTEKILNLTKTSQKNYKEESDEGDIFLKLMFNIPQNYMVFIMIYYIYQKKWRLKN